MNNEALLDQLIISIDSSKMKRLLIFLNTCLYYQRIFEWGLKGHGEFRHGSRKQKLIFSCFNSGKHIAIYFVYVLNIISEIRKYLYIYIFIFFNLKILQRNQKNGIYELREESMYFIS